MVLYGIINGRQCKILKDDGCNTNIISTDFVKRNGKILKIINNKLSIEHSQENSSELISGVVVDAIVQIGRHQYRSNWAIVNCRYDVILGMPWHMDNQVIADYSKQTLTVNGRLLPVPKTANNGYKITNIGVKKFRSFIRKNGHKPGFELFHITEVNNLSKASTKAETPLPPDIQHRKDEILKKYTSVFRDELPEGLPPKRSVDHEINIAEGSKPPHQPLFQLSPSELIATKNYVTDMLNKGKIRPSRSPYGAPLFFVRQQDKLRGVIDYRALNRITKRNNSPIPRTDEMFDRIGKAKVFSKLDLKAGFHQIRVRNEDIEKTAFKTKYGSYEFLVMPMGL